MPDFIRAIDSSSIGLRPFRESLKYGIDKLTQVQVM